MTTGLEWEFQLSQQSWESAVMQSHHYQSSMNSCCAPSPRPGSLYLRQKLWPIFNVAFSREEIVLHAMLHTSVCKIDEKFMNCESILHVQALYYTNTMQLDGHHSGRWLPSTLLDKGNPSQHLSMNTQVSGGVSGTGSHLPSRFSWMEVS